MSGKKRVVVVGGTGFLGSHLTRQLVVIGYDVVVATRGDAALVRNLRRFIVSRIFPRDVTVIFFYFTSAIILIFFTRCSFTWFTSVFLAFDGKV
jgi:uncharacterized protein YbjT (DUF2867 family)